MKPKKYALPVFLLTLLLASLACTIFVGGPDYSNLAPIPVSTEAAESLKEEIKKAFEDGATTGMVTLTITEPQITSVLAFRLLSDPNMQTNQKPSINDPQVYVRNGEMKFFVFKQKTAYEIGQ